MQRMSFLNETGFMGVVFESFTTNVSGSVFLTLLAIFVLLIGLFIMFRIPIETILVLVLPVVLVFMAYAQGGFLAVGGVIIILLGIILAKNWFIK